MKTKNTKCIICDNEFQLRRGKLYCSNACKQDAFRNKNDLLHEQIEGNNTMLNLYYTFNMAEWYDFKKIFKERGMDHVEYFFIRLLFDIPYERKALKRLFNEFFDVNYDYERKNKFLYKKYCQFKQLIASGNVKFIETDLSFMTKVQIGGFSDTFSTNSRPNKHQLPLNSYWKIPKITFKKLIHYFFRRRV